MANNEFGDFQTPLALAELVLRAIPNRAYARVLEPTCGSGNFVRAAGSRLQSAQVIGVEVQPRYVAAAASAAPSAEIYNADIFSLDLRRALEWRVEGPLLVVGNPPWVTNAALSMLSSANVPGKSNVKRLKGLEAVTGSANFDVAEFIWLKLLSELQDQHPTIALLCKTQVARNVLVHAARQGLPIKEASIKHVDARRWFGAGVDACLFTVTCGKHAYNYSCEVFSTLDALEPERVIGVRGSHLISHTASYDSWQFAHGTSPLEWRQGIKHDAAKVMELRPMGEYLINGYGDPVRVEDSHVLPLLKCTDLHKGHVSSPLKRMIVSQHALGEDTSVLSTVAPSLWEYLNTHANVLDGRKSSIYRRRSRFSIFGVGPYSFAPWKVAVSGLHAAANFRLVPPSTGRPVVLDDTCYFLPFEQPEEAVVVHALLSSTGTRALLKALMFEQAKRPVTKKLLQQVDLLALLRAEDLGQLERRCTLAAKSAGMAVSDWKTHYDRLLADWSKGIEGRLDFTTGV